MRTFRILFALGLLGLATVVVLLVLYNLAGIYYLPTAIADRSPVQPIAFSHRLHAGDNGIHCLYCHRSANSADIAGIPDMDLCRSCHMFIAQDRPEVVKVMGYVEKGEPIPWVRVHDLPDFVFFPHKMHLAGGVRCSECHGAVDKMDRIERVTPLDMGFCLDCHRKRGVSIDCLTCHR